jgi:hypothetical protein
MVVGVEHVHDQQSGLVATGRVLGQRLLPALGALAFLQLLAQVLGLLRSPSVRLGVLLGLGLARPARLLGFLSLLFGAQVLGLVGQVSVSSSW